MEQTWEFGPGDATRELRTLMTRKLCVFPQGFQHCVDVLKTSQSQGRRFRIRAIKTIPWTWFYDLI